MNIMIAPLNKPLYDERVKAAYDCFKHADIMPPFLVTYMCYSVMYRALGGNVGVLRYVLDQFFSDLWWLLKRKEWTSDEL